MKSVKKVIAKIYEISIFIPRSVLRLLNYFLNVIKIIFEEIL